MPTNPEPEDGHDAGRERLAAVFKHLIDIDGKGEWTAADWGLHKFGDNPPEGLRKDTLARIANNRGDVKMDGKIKRLSAAADCTWMTFTQAYLGLRDLIESSKFPNGAKGEVRKAEVLQAYDIAQVTVARRAQTG